MNMLTIISNKNSQSFSAKVAEKYFRNFMEFDDNFHKTQLFFIATEAYTELRKPICLLFYLVLVNKALIIELWECFDEQFEHKFEMLL